MRHRETARDVVLHADGHHAVAVDRVVPAEDLHHDRSDDNRDQGAGNLRGNFWPQDADGEGHEAHDDGIDIDRIERGGVKLDLADGVGGVLREEAEPEEVRHLAERDDDGDTRGKAHGHRVRDELDDGAELRDAENDEQNTREECRGGQAVVAVLAHDAVDNHDEGARGAADLEARTAQKRNGEARDNRRVEALFGTHARGDGKRNRKRQSQNAHDEARHQVAHEIFLGIAPADRAEQFGGNRRLDASEETLYGFLGMDIGHRALRSKRTAPNLENFTIPVKGKKKKITDSPCGDYNRPFFAERIRFFTCFLESCGTSASFWARDFGAHSSQ